MWIILNRFLGEQIGKPVMIPVIIKHYAKIAILEKVIYPGYLRHKITAPNTACTRRVGVCAFLSSFLASSWFCQSGVVSSRPPAGNAHRWAAFSPFFSLATSLSPQLNLEVLTQYSEQT